jgi:hypothetical protein
MIEKAQEEECIVKPMKPLSPYTFYMKENLTKIKDQKSLSNTDAMKSCAEQWSRLSEKQKKKF